MTKPEIIPNPSAEELQEAQDRQLVRQIDRELGTDLEHGPVTHDTMTDLLRRAALAELKSSNPVFRLKAIELGTKLLPQTAIESVGSSKPTEDESLSRPGPRPLSEGLYGKRGEGATG